MTAVDLTVDLFAGPGGWDEGARAAGLAGRLVGAEKDPDACATALAAGHDRYCGDVSMIPVGRFGRFRGLIASPPCPAFSTGGKGLGRLDLPRIMRHLARIRDAGRWLHYSREGWHDPTSPLVLEPVRWALEGRPEWVACEQVPAVLPFWQAFAELLRDFGYVTSAGVMHAEQYGVPQTRSRAILVARWATWWNCATLPKPTHGKHGDTDTPLPRPVGMADVNGWAPGDLVGFPRRARSDRPDETRHTVTLDGVEYRARDFRRASEPAFVLTSKSRSWSRWTIDGRRLPVTVDEAARLQSFRAGYPWHGSQTVKFRQIGDAVPPALAAAVIGELLGQSSALTESDVA